jgi:predicted dienelactone hydrolase
MRVLKRMLKYAAGLILLAIVAVGLLLTALRIEHNTAATLPTPTGPLAVGRSSFLWVDDLHIDTLAPLPQTKRELVAWIWYPADASQSPVTEDYFPTAWRRAVEQYWGFLSTQLLEKDRSLVQVHSVRDAEVAADRAKYPVVVFRAGLAALTLEYTTLAEDLASHGYVVVGFDAPYRTQVVVLPDGSVIQRAPQNDPESVGGQDGERIASNLVGAWSADIGFALDQMERLDASDLSGKFTGRLDMSHVGAFGHSLGGASAAQFCHEDARCKAVVDIDGAPYGSVLAESLQKPFMFLMSDHSAEVDSDDQRIELNIRSIYDRLPRDSRQYLVILGADHFGFSDGAVVRSQIVLRMLRTLGIVGIEGRRQLLVTAYCVHGFFDAHLKESLSRFQIESSKYPEIQLLQ